MEPEQSSYRIQLQPMASALQIVENKKEVTRGAKDYTSRVLGFPRLMDLQTGADYCSIGYWTLRGAVQRGLIPVVEWPGEDGEPIRRVLLDREDLDKFVDGLLRHRRPG